MQILGASVGGTAVAVGLLFVDEIAPVQPLLLAACILGVVWTARAAIGLLQSTDVSPMSDDDYARLRVLDLNHHIFEEVSRLSRWSYALLWVSVGYTCSALGADDSIIASVGTFVFSLIGAAYAFDLTLVCVALTATAALLWGISLLPIPLAIVVGSGIVAYAIYKRR